MKSVFTPKNFAALVFILAGGFLLRQTYAERVVFYVSQDELGPMTYPRYLLWAWMVLSVLYLVIPRKPFDLSAVKAGFPTLAGSALAMVLYMVLFKYGGLFLSTFIFLVVFFYILNYRHPGRMILLASATALSAWLIFEKLLEVPMPPSFFGMFSGG